MKLHHALAAAAVLLLPSRMHAAIGCTLSNPAQDLKYLFPEMTTYKEVARQFDQMKDGRVQFRSLRDRLGSDLDPVYETYETPYTVYQVFRGAELVGIVHGVNVPGRGGVIQVFLATDPGTGAIRNLFFQRIESPAARALKDKAFRAQFQGLTLADFYKHDYFKVADPGSGNDRVARIAAPRLEGPALEDYQASLRGIRKNLILLDMFIFNLRYEPYYQRSKESLAKIRNRNGKD